MQDSTQLKQRRSLAAATVEASIEASFGSVLLDGGVTLHQMDVLDDCGSSEAMASAAQLDREVRWQELADAKLKRFGLSLVFLDAKGFRFYLPAYLRIIARQLGSSVPDSDRLDLCGVWFALRGDWYDQEHHYPLLSDAQRSSVAEFLKVMSELGDPEECVDAEEALRLYWHAYG